MVGPPQPTLNAAPAANHDAPLDVLAPALAPEPAPQPIAEPAPATDHAAPCPAERVPAAPGSSKYTDLETLLSFALSGDVQFVKASYYLELKRQGRVFPTRQGLPPEACASAADVRRWGNEIRATLALRKKYTEWRSCEEIQHGARFPPFVVTSYAWLSPAHPDPDGRQLGEVLAPAIEWYMSERARYISGDVWAVNNLASTSLYSAAKDEAKLAAPFTPDGIDFGIFLDFTSLWQKDPAKFDASETPDAKSTSERPSFEQDLQAGRKFFGGAAYEQSRTEEEKASFSRALQSMDLLYAHQETMVWRMTRLVDGYPHAKPYGDRGWPFFETSAAHYIKRSWLNLNLGSKTAVGALSGFKPRNEERIIKFEGVARAPEDLAEQGTYFHHTGMPGVIAELKDQRLPPLVPEEFAARAESKALTNGKDKQVLLDLQRTVSTTVLAGVQEMSFVRLGWGGDDGALLAKALPLCHTLRILDVRYNNISGDGAAQLAAAVLAMPSIESFNNIPVKEMRADSFITLGLTHKNFGGVGCLVLAGLLPVMASLTSVSLLGNNLGPETVSMLLKLKAEKPALVSLCGLNPGQTEANFACGGLGPVDAQVLAPELAINASLTSLLLQHNSLGAEGAKALAPALAANASLTSVSLDGNRLCGVWDKDEDSDSDDSDDDDARAGKKGTYDATGINAIADALRVSASLTSCDVRRNSISGEGASQLAAAVLANTKIEKFNEIPIKEMRADLLTKLELPDEGIGVEGGLVVAGLMPVMASLTELNLSNNKLCGVDYRGGTYDATGINAVADALRVNTSLTKLDVRYNTLDDEAKAAIKEAVSSKEGFELLIKRHRC